MTTNQPTDNAWPQAGVNLEQYFEIQQFLYREARLLDERRFDEWVALLAEDIRYWIPNRISRKGDNREENWAVEKELSGPGELPLSDNNKLLLELRVMRVKGGRSFSETPPSRTQRLITNIEVAVEEDPALYRVRSNFLVNRTRLEKDEHTFVGNRCDLIQRTETGFLIKERRVVLNGSLLKSPNLSIFF